MRFTPTRTAAAVLALALVGAACGDSDESGDIDGGADEATVQVEDGEVEQVTEPGEGAAVVEISGVDFAFEDVPDEMAAGSVSLGFTNNGESAHEMAVFKLGDGVVLDDLLAAETEPTEEQATEIGGTFGTPGEGPFYVNAELEPGTYALVCFIPGPEEKPHHELGMKTTFTVALERSHADR